MKRKLIALAAALCLLLSGCSPITLSVEDLMRPPQLSESQRQVHDALMSALGTSGSNVSLRYPRSGSNRSAFTFFDLDGDGQQEAMVFYTLADAQDDFYINVMEQGEQGWYSVYDIPGVGSGVESVEFAPVTDADGRDIIIGWAAEENSIGQLSVLRYQDNKLSSLYQSRYTKYTTADLNQDGLLELLTVTMSNSGGKPFASLITRREGKLDAVSNLPLNLNMTSFSRLYAGWINPFETGLVVDGYEGQTFTSELLLIKNEMLSLPFAEESPFYTDVARRQGVVYSRDVDGDDILELPIQKPAPGKTGLYYTDYCQVNGEQELELVETAYVSDSEGYIFYLPEQWRDRVTVSRSKTGEVVFGLYDAETGMQGRDLLRIRVYSEKDYQDKFDTERYQKIGRRGNFLYYVNVVEGEELSITQGQVKELFEII
ncbi:MAG: hypothetical protein J6B40_06620 [Oscillospiraceae bacterium]|nr:hypothetical protein [Oscillospiraceae bacterium]MBQ8917535.1 hypothetical protein [Oscillospiraceae bacterium]